MLEPFPRGLAILQVPQADARPVLRNRVQHDEVFAASHSALIELDRLSPAPTSTFPCAPCQCTSQRAACAPRSTRKLALENDAKRREKTTRAPGCGDELIPNNSARGPRRRRARLLRAVRYYLQVGVLASSTNVPGLHVSRIARVQKLAKKVSPAAGYRGRNFLPR